MVLVSGSGVLTVVRKGSDGSSQEYINPIVLEQVTPGRNQKTRIELSLRNNELSVAINGSDLGGLMLDNTPNGSVGMIVLCGDTNGQVDFDNFSLSELRANE